MININTLNELNSLGIGANISKLESYIADYKQANNVADLYSYEYEYRILSKILKEIKQESLAFTDKTDLIECDTDEFDELLIQYPNCQLKTVYGSRDKNIDNLFSYITSKPENCMDMVAIPDVLGLNIRCSYLNGYIYRINLIGNGYKYTDITNRFKERLPKYVEQFSKNRLTELRGKITIFKNSIDSLDDMVNIECGVMHLIRMGTNDAKMSIIFNDIVATDDSDFTVSNHWDKLEYLRSLGFSVPHHALIRNVEGGAIPDALRSFREYFKDIENTTGIIYNYHGYQIRDNDVNEYTTDWSKFNYVFDDCDYREVFSARIKSIQTLNNGDIKVLVKIVATDCNDELTITEINVQDISLLDSYNIEPGNKINFFIDRGKAYIAKNR